ncbi:MAG: FAD-dependent oxidoreductase, partial [Nitrosopumilus sp.]
MKKIVILGSTGMIGKKSLIIAKQLKYKIIGFSAGENIKLIEKNKKIEIITNTNVTEILGDKFVNKVILDKEYNGSKELKLDGIFGAIGHIPLSDLAVKLGVKINKKKEIIVDRESKTNVQGVFAAGDIIDSGFKQAITGVAEGVVAAHSA